MSSTYFLSSTERGKTRTVIAGGSHVNQDGREARRARARVRARARFSSGSLNSYLFTINGINMALRIKIKVVPNAAKNSVEGWHGDALRIRIAAAPDRGRANEELIEFLGELLSLPKREIQILSGHTSCLKWVEIQADWTLEELLYQLL